MHGLFALFRATMLRRLQMKNMGRLRQASKVWLFGLLAATLASGGGCTRAFYRKQTDRQVLAVLAEKDKAPWKILGFSPYPDIMARFGDRSNPDRPPMPPDDPGAKDLSPNPQKPYHSGVGRVESPDYLEVMAGWDAENRARQPLVRQEAGIPSSVPSFAELLRTTPTPYIDSPDQLPQPRALDGSGECRGDPPAVPQNLDQPYFLTLDQSVILGTLNSRELQAERENLYLMAMPVTMERFSFAAQFQAFGSAFYGFSGRETGERQGHRWTVNSSAGVGKLFSTGALLLMNWANRTVVNISGDVPRTVTSVSTLSLDFVQPLLRGGGKAVTLEPLTQVERYLLYEIRFFARFRQQFYQYVTGGGALDSFPGPITDLNRNPVFAGVVDGVGGGGFINTTGIPISGSGALPLLPGTVGRIDLSTNASNFTPPSNQGYLPTLFRATDLWTEMKNADNLQKYLRLYEAFEEGGNVSPLQVEQVKQRLYQSLSNILTKRQTLRDALDNFKIQLGLPTNLLIELDDSFIYPISRQLIKFERVIDQIENAVKDIDSYEPMEEAKLMRDRLEKLLTQSDLVKETVLFKENFPKRWASWKKLDAKTLEDRLSTLRARRRDLYDKKTNAEISGKPFPSELRAELARLEREIPLGEFENTIRRYQAEPWRKIADERARKFQHVARFRDLRNTFQLVLAEAGNERLDQISRQWPDLPPIDIDGEDLMTVDLEKAFEIATRAALNERLDLMNVRAEVVDSWRQLRIYANSLLGVFNVGYHGDSFTPPGLAEPLAFSQDRARHQLTMNFQLPLVRYAERNNYRAVLIAYQRARRSLMAAEDAIAFQVRADIRQLRVFATNYKIQQKQMELAYRIVESALETFRAPPNPLQGANTAGNEAALTQQLLNAQASLPQAQNQLYSIWINYRIVRQRIYLDTGIMQVDERGLWMNDNGQRTHLSESVPGTGRGAGQRGADARLLGVSELPPQALDP
ncbi:MAG: hypothetical protein FJ271_07905 [Planctomycetes bacterium]|nr:hypothetical protein [Planctomycetota bacterium]